MGFEALRRGKISSPEYDFRPIADTGNVYQYLGDDIGQHYDLSFETLHLPSVDQRSDRGGHEETRAVSGL
jgi:hypothetical protein